MAGTLLPDPPRSATLPSKARSPGWAWQLRVQVQTEPLPVRLVVLSAVWFTMCYHNAPMQVLAGPGSHLRRQNPVNGQPLRCHRGHSGLPFHAQSTSQCDVALGGGEVPMGRTHRLGKVSLVF